jgi:hypothetical protein
MLQMFVWLALGIGFPLFFFYLDASSEVWMELGAQTWIIAIIIKAILGIGISAFSRRILKTERGTALTWGIWSAFCEILPTIYILQIHSLSKFQNIIHFGVGAASIETLTLFIFHLMNRHWETSESNQPPSDLLVNWGMVLERAYSFGLYTATRGMVWLGISISYLFPLLLLALGFFALITGVSTYGQVRGWNWADPLLCRKFYTFQLLTILVQIFFFTTLIFLVQYKIL